MKYIGDAKAADNVKLLPFDDKYYSQYEHVYNECFYDMRRALDIQPYNFYFDIRQLNGKKENIFLLMEGETIVGSVGCFGAEIDDLIVNKWYQGKGFGKQLLIWAIGHIREYTVEPITLHVAEWNKRAVGLYTQNGFVIKSKKLIRRMV